MSRLLETIRIENFSPQNLELHLKRMEYAAKSLWNGPPPDLSIAFENIKFPGPEIFKCNIRYDNNELEISFMPYQIRPVGSLKLVNADQLDYSLKFADRSAIDELFMLRENSDDVLFVKNGLITDTSYANIALLKENRWVTPVKPLLNGTMRQYLLQNGILTEVIIRPVDLPVFSKIRLINAMMPWGTGPEIRIEDLTM